MFRRGLARPSRLVAALLVATLITPGIQWCRFAWADLPAECLVECAIVPRMAGCPISEAAAEPAAEATTPCGMTCPSRAAHAEGERPCERAATADAPIAAPTSDAPRGDVGPTSGRAWCPLDPTGGPTAHGAAPHALEPVALDGLVPDVSLAPEQGASQRVVELGFARPPTHEPTRTPPTRAPPTC